MNDQMLLNIQRAQFVAEWDALIDNRDFFDIDLQVSVLDAYLADW